MTTDKLMSLIEGPIDAHAKAVAQEIFTTIHGNIGNLAWGDVPGLQSPNDWVEILRPAFAQRTFRYLSLELAEQAAGWETVIGKGLSDRG